LEFYFTGDLDEFIEKYEVDQNFKESGGFLKAPQKSAEKKVGSKKQSNEESQSSDEGRTIPGGRYGCA